MRVTGIDPTSGTQIQVDAENGVFTAVDELIARTDTADYITPGFVDLQVNGYAAVDYNSPHTPHEEISRSIHVLYSTGTTRFLPTVITGSREGMLGSLVNLAKAKRSIPEGESIEGFHVEGPHICPDDGPRGAHPVQHVRQPDIDEYRRWQDQTGGLVRLVTVSPEWDGVAAYIEALVADGVVVSIGHTKATAAQIQTAVSAGATLSTHLGNGAHSVLPRHPNYLWDQLAEDRLSAGFIVDGIHLGENYFKVALRAKGLTRSFLVTDASMPACATPGRYRLGEVDVELTEDNRVVLVGQSRLAGSALRMNDGIANTIRQTGISLSDALSLANRNPARLGRIPGRQRGFAPGDRADVVLFDYDQNTKAIRIKQTYVSGRRVYSAAA